MIRSLLLGLRDSLSIALGYVPVAISFGLAAIHLGISPYMVVLFSVLIYAGASQFILITLIAQQTGLFSIVLIIWLMNVRHLFYGPALLKSVGLASDERKLPLVAWAAGLTDEVFATAIGRVQHHPRDQREGWYIGLQLGAYSAWVGGTAIGAYFGADWIGKSVVLDQSLGFVLPALFFALLLDIASAVARPVLWVTAICTAFAMFILPAYMALILGMVAGAVVAALINKHD
ncbi:MAG TPA: AzlC family ABC transporter permease [Paenalcaligenes sp.]|nr:AzlC family ABC transporter permease [Paenalcaligenes sp.]